MACICKLQSQLQAYSPTGSCYNDILHGAKIVKSVKKQ
jgi:hypothetical protein